jgi:hypothetical protein
MPVPLPDAIDPLLLTARCQRRTAQQSHDAIVTETCRAAGMAAITFAGLASGDDFAGFAGIA